MINNTFTINPTGEYFINSSKLLSKAMAEASRAGIDTDTLAISRAIHGSNVGDEFGGDKFGSLLFALRSSMLNTTTVEEYIQACEKHSQVVRAVRDISRCFYGPEGESEVSLMQSVCLANKFTGKCGTTLFKATVDQNSEIFEMEMEAGNHHLVIAMIGCEGYEEVVWRYIKKHRFEEVATRNILPDRVDCTATLVRVELDDDLPVHILFADCPDSKPLGDYVSGVCKILEEETWR